MIWEFKPTNTGVFANYGVNANRGVAYCDGNLYLLTLDMRIDAINASSGKLVNEVAISDAVPGALAQYSYSETQAPICYKNMLIIGASGSDYGVRGFVMAYHTDLTAAWSSPYWIVPPDDEEWRSAGNYTGGGTNWNPVTIDPTDNMLYRRRRTRRRSSIRRSGPVPTRAPTRSSRSTLRPGARCGGSSRSPATSGATAPRSRCSSTT